MEDRSSHVLAVGILFFVLTWVTVSLRTVSRGWVIRSFGIDDKLMIVLLLFFTAYLVSQLLGWQHGTGRHRADISPEDYREALKWWFVCELLYILCTCLLKISVGFFLLRVAINPVHVWILRVLMIGTVLFGTTYFFMVTFQCVPVSTFWEESPREPGKCFNDGVVSAMTYIASTVNCAADWAFGTLPIFIVWSLNLPVQTRIMVCVILGFAAVGSSATIVRATYIPTLLRGEDFLYETADVAIWSTVEPGIGITAASMATLRPLWQWLQYRAGLRSTGPSNIMWQERNRGKPSRIWSDEESRQRRLRPDNSLYTATVSGPQPTNNSHNSHRSNVGSIDSTAGQGISKTVEVSQSRSNSIWDASLYPGSDTELGHSRQAKDKTHKSRDRSSHFEMENSDSPIISQPAPTVDWISPRVSVISMGWWQPRSQRSSMAG